MKKNLFKLSACALAGAALAACCGTGASGPQHVSHEALASGFVTPPDSIQTSVYWYWISNNISKEGVIKDLESMKKAGINRAFIGNIGQDDVPYGNVKMLSEEWWDILHAALKKATELDIEIGIFNSPGWSQSGGPWVKADQAMRYLASSETRAKGPQKFNAKLVQPTDSFQDVRVIAYPVPKDDQLTLNASNGTITSTPKVADLTKITDGDQKSGIAIPKGGEITIDLKANAPFTARSLTVKPTEHPLGAQGELQVKEGGGRIDPGHDRNRFPGNHQRRQCRQRLGRSGSGSRSARRTLQRKDAGEDAPDSAAVLERLSMAGTARCGRRRADGRSREGTGHLAIPGCRRHADMGCSGRRMGNPAHGYDSDRDDQFSRRARSDRL